jgi:peptidoglycan/LPS O-acetylase OafA/YrhL
LRFFAALAVVLFHTAGVFLGTAWMTSPVAVWVSGGFLGVSLFFVLSGFLLAYVYLEPDAGLRVPTRSYAWARFARIYPLYLFALAVAVPALFLDIANVGTIDGILATRDHLPALTTSFRAALATPAGSGGWILHLSPTVALLQAWLPSRAWRVWDPPAWSLSCEFFFYAVFPLLGAWIARRDSGTRWALAGGAYALSVGYAVAFWALGFRFQGEAASDIGSSLLYYWPIARLPEFLIGVVLGLHVLDRKDVRRDSASRALRWIGLLGVTVGIVGLSALPTEWSRTGLFAPVFGALILGLRGGAGVAGRVLASRPLVLGGEASYGIYLFHLPLATLYLALVGPGNALGPLSFVGYLAVLLAVSLVAYRWIERPARRTIRAWAEGREAPRRRETGASAEAVAE